MEMMSAAVLLFLIMDPLGNLPVFMSVLRHLEPKRRRFVLLRELLIALLVMMLFLFAGDHLLSFLNVREETVSISGGIILFLIAIRMIFPKPGGVTGLKPGEEPFLVPLAIPLVAGPSVLAALLLLAKQHPGENMTLVLARDLYPQRLEGDEPEPLDLIYWPLSEIDRLLAHPEFNEARAMTALFMVRDWLRAEAQSDGQP